MYCNVQPGFKHFYADKALPIRIRQNDTMRIAQNERIIR